MTNKIQKKLSEKFEYWKEFVKAKNKKYGDSAINPVRIFSKAGSKEGILIRLDDKISRLIRGNLELDQELIRDIVGYLALYSIKLDEENGKEYQKERID